MLTHEELTTRMRKSKARCDAMTGELQKLRQKLEQMHLEHIREQTRYQEYANLLVESAKTEDFAGDKAPDANGMAAATAQEAGV